MNDEEDPSLDEDFPLGDGTAETEAVVSCPYCGESIEITVDPGGGNEQEYVEDCEVCCQPWLLRVRYTGGAAHVTAAQLDA